MAGPVQTVNTLTPDTVGPGGSSTWVTVAQDADARTAVLSRKVRDSQDPPNEVTITRTITIADPLTYDPPTCDDPGVTLVVDSNDPTIVHVSVAG